MRYKYKDEIKEDLEYLLEGVSIDYHSSEELIHEQKVKEIDLVYSQAAKADEYEAKAEAFDELYAEFDKGDKDLSIADFNEVIERYKFGDSHD